jgi:hypothetical protein
MTLTRSAVAVIKLSPISVLVLFASCDKKERTAQSEKHEWQAKSAATPTARVYKLGKPRPIVLNVDKPLIVPAVTPTPKPTPKR